MKHIIAIIFFFLLLTNTAFSAGEELDTQSRICPGMWTLLHSSGWVVQNEAGEIIPLTASTTVFGCDKKPISLEDDFSGVSVDIECTPSAVANGLPDIDSVFIVCE